MLSNMTTAQKWEVFGWLVSEIVSGNMAAGTWEQKAKNLLEVMDDEGRAGDFEELVNWFGGDVNEEIE